MGGASSSFLNNRHILACGTQNNAYCPFQKGGWGEIKEVNCTCKGEGECIKTEGGAYYEHPFLADKYGNPMVWDGTCSK